MEQLFDFFNNLKFHKFEILDYQRTSSSSFFKISRIKEAPVPVFFLTLQVPGNYTEGHLTGSLILSEHQNKFFDSQICD
jgi:hypothetical protein